MVISVEEAHDEIPEEETIGTKTQSTIEMLKTEAAREGHNAWLASQSPTKRTLGFPNKEEFRGRETRSGLMPFETMEFIKANVKRTGGEGYDITITPEELELHLILDLQNLGLGDWLSGGLGYLDYLKQVPTEIFRIWMVEVATDRFHDNDAWGETAEAYLKYNDINLDQNLPEAKIRDIIKLINGVNKMQSVTAVGDLVGVDGLLNNTELLESLVIAHANWRKSQYFRGKTKVVLFEKDLIPKEFAAGGAFVHSAIPDWFKERYPNSGNIGNEILSLIANFSDSDADYNKLSAQIKDIRTRLHKDFHLSAGITFALMVHLAVKLEDTSKVEVTRKDMLLKLADDMVQTIKWDANPAIPRAIVKVYENIHGEGSIMERV